MSIQDLTPCRVFIIACEASGDRHGADLVEAIRALDPQIEWEGLGGPEMKKAGVRILEEVTSRSVLGLGDVLRNYFYFRRIFYGALTRVKKIKPDLLILIDSPAFNLRFAKKIKQRIPTYYYISPQIWAWGWRRIHTIRKNVTHMISILPFEKEMYEKEGVPCTFVGHPLMDRVRASKSREALRQEFQIKEGERVIALLAGSREPEVRRILPVMLEASQRLQGETPDLRFFLSQAPNVSRSLYDEILNRHSGLRLVRFSERTYDYVRAADFALVASGTATLETALLGTPFFLLYKASASTFFFGRRLVRLPYIGLVNVLAGRHVVPEFIQHLAEPARIAHDAKLMLENDSLREKLTAEIQEGVSKLGGGGASERAARLILASHSPHPSARPAHPSKA